MVYFNDTPIPEYCQLSSSLPCFSKRMTAQFGYYFKGNDKTLNTLELFFENIFRYRFKSFHFQNYADIERLS